MYVLYPLAHVADEQSPGSLPEHAVQLPSATDDMSLHVADDMALHVADMSLHAVHSPPENVWCPGLQLASEHS